MDNLIRHIEFIISAALKDRFPDPIGFVVIDRFFPSLDQESKKDEHQLVTKNNEFI